MALKKKKNLLIFLLFLSFNTPIFSNTNSNIEYLFPLPNSKQLPIETPIIIRLKNIAPNDIDNLNSFITAQDSVGNLYSGETVISTDQKTIIYYFSSPLPPEAEIIISLAPKINNQDTNYFEYSSSFVTKSELYNTKLIKPGLKKQKYNQTFPNRKTSDPVLLNGISVPSNFPFVEVTTNRNPDTNYLFLATYVGYGYALMLDNQGLPVWYWRTKDNILNFRKHSNGKYSVNLRSDNSGAIIFDSNLSIMDTIYSPDGYIFDDHEFVMTRDNHYLFIINDFQIVDMRQYVTGGSEEAVVIGNSLIEMDRELNPILIWRCWDHYNITDAVASINLTQNRIDYVHMNSIRIDLDRNLLLSCRHMNEITKIDRSTGEIIWRLGGENDQFTWVNDQWKIAHQHHVSSTPEGNYVLFDNGNNRPPEFSRALEISVDTVSKSVTKIWEYRGTDEYYSWAEGSAHRLSNGNTLTDWAAAPTPKVAEITSDSEKVFEMSFEEGTSTYRAYRFHCELSVSSPYLIIENRTDKVTLLFNHFGKKNIDHYNIYCGKSQQPATIFATSTEPFFSTSELDNNQAYFFRVTSVDSNQVESDYSNEEEVFVNLINPGENMIFNGDFSFGFFGWDLKLNAAEADWNINDGVLCIDITNGGNSYQRVQLVYEGIQLAQGRQYTLEFDIYSDEVRIIEIELQKSFRPYNDYSKIGLIYIDENKQHFSRTFTMESPDDSHARLVFSVGAKPFDIYLDNVELKEKVINPAEEHKKLNPEFMVSNNYPEPFRRSTTIQYQIPVFCEVSLKIYNILGQETSRLIQKYHQPGNYEIQFHPDGYPTGIYFYAFEVRDLNRNLLYRKIKKMVILK